jgi:hypothetical protein
MQRLILSVLLVSALNVPAVKAEMSAYKPQMNVHPITEVQPFNLVYLGYQGFFQDRGIPSNGAFLSAIRSGRVNGTKLVQIAIERGRLAPETINDRGYLSAVDDQLEALFDN